MASVQESASRSTKISAEERAALERLLSSGTMTRAPRLLAILKFLIDALVEGRTAPLNEQSIGQAVFGLRDGYSPGDDNIVRVSIRHLRARLEEFYNKEGLKEKYVLDIPKGKYLPSLTRREAPVAASKQPLGTPEIELAPKQVIGTPIPAIQLRLAWTVAALFMITSAVLGYFLFRQLNSRSPEPDRGMLQMLVQNGSSTLVVVGDSNLQAYRQIFGKQVPLTAYLDRSYTLPGANLPDSTLSRTWQYISETTDTNVTSAIIAAAIQKVEPPGTVFIRHPHDVSMRDFQHDDFILLGGPWIDPWGQMFEERLNFRFEPRTVSPAQSEIHNLNPLPGEPSVFVPHQEGQLTVNYARIAVLPNMSGNGRVIMVGATSPESLEAGGRFLMQESSLQKLLLAFKVPSAAQLPSFEVVLEVEGIESVPDRTRIIAQRLVH